MHVADLHGHPWIRQRVTEHMRQRSLGPVHDLGYEFGDNDTGHSPAGPPAPRPSVKPMPSPPISICAPSRTTRWHASVARGPLRSAGPAHHQLGVVIFDREILVPLPQEQLTCRPECRPCQSARRAVLGSRRRRSGGGSLGCGRGCGGHNGLTCRQPRSPHVSVQSCW